MYFVQNIWRHHNSRYIVVTARLLKLDLQQEAGSTNNRKYEKCSLRIEILLKLSTNWMCLYFVLHAFVYLHILFAYIYIMILSWWSDKNLWVLRTELRLSGLVVSSFTCWAILFRPRTPMFISADKEIAVTSKIIVKDISTIRH